MAKENRVVLEFGTAKRAVLSHIASGHSHTVELGKRLAECGSEKVQVTENENSCLWAMLAEEQKLLQKSGATHYGTHLIDILDELRDAIEKARDYFRLYRD